ncbi:MarR family winged helix-turn-helix transcriptional regulator, partial [Pseudonocardia pini]|uniref:MarR family winged helix-turn-helix transcriptional regulator n=1 Tax=Pseudonocardia pini TaxID=2758030 RepID=UPI001C68CF0B
MTPDDGRVRLAAHPAFLLAQLGAHVKVRFTEDLAPLGIAPRHFDMLALLTDTDGLTQQQIAEQLRIHRNVMVGLVDELEAEGLAERRRHPTDRRAYTVHLLPAGRELLTRADHVFEAFEHDDLLATLTAAERRTLTDLLQRVATGSGLPLGVHPAFRGAPD